MSLVVVIAILTLGVEKVEKYEYKLELINQETVKLRNIKDGSVYITTPDSLVYYLELDNL